VASVPSFPYLADNGNRCAEEVPLLNLDEITVVIGDDVCSMTTSRGYVSVGLAGVIGLSAALLGLASEAQAKNPSAVPAATAASGKAKRPPAVKPTNWRNKLLGQPGSYPQRFASDDADPDFVHQNQSGRILTIESGVSDYDVLRLDLFANGMVVRTITMNDFPQSVTWMVPKATVAKIVEEVNSTQVLNIGYITENDSAIGGEFISIKSEMSSVRARTFQSGIGAQVAAFAHWVAAQIDTGAKTKPWNPTAVRVTNAYSIDASSTPEFVVWDQPESLSALLGDGKSCTVLTGKSAAALIRLSGSNPRESKPYIKDGNKYWLVQFIASAPGETLSCTPVPQPAPTLVPSAAAAALVAFPAPDQLTPAVWESWTLERLGREDYQTEREFAPVPLVSPAKDCVVAAAQQSITAWTQSRIVSGSYAPATAAEEERLAKAAVACGAAGDVLVHHFNDSGVLLASTLDCLRTTWNASPVANIAIKFVVFKSRTQIDRAFVDQYNAIQKSCITQEDIDALRKRVRETFDKISNTLP
jgi:hypothetical protein